MYGFAVQAINKDSTRGELIYQQPLHSAEEVEVLKKRFIEGDEGIERQSYYFPYIQQAQKLQIASSRALAIFKGFFLDLVTLPYRMYTYGEYKAELKQRLPIYQYLRSHNVPQKYLEHDRFELVFFSGEKPAAPYIREGGIVRLVAGNKFDPAKFEGRNYQEHLSHDFDVYYGPNRSTGYGLSLLTDEHKAWLSQTYIAP